MRSVQQKEYDDKISQHYREVAKKHGLSATSTMEDDLTRNLETAAIIQFVGEYLRLYQGKSKPKQTIIMDVGCGNGHTVDVLLNGFPDQMYFGMEKSDELRSLAVSRFQGKNNIKICEADIRDKHFANGITANILICQRVLINLLDREDQKSALNNILNAVTSSSVGKPGGALLFIESFLGPLARLNESRAEFDLPPIPQAHHNLYLPDDFFNNPQLKPFETDGLLSPPNFLSTHYYVTRVLHPVFTQNKTFKRNSEFVRFFTHALKQNAGDYSPLKLYMFEKTDKAIPSG